MLCKKKNRRSFKFVVFQFLVLVFFTNAPTHTPICAAKHTPFCCVCVFFGAFFSLAHFLFSQVKKNSEKPQKFQSFFLALIFATIQYMPLRTLFVHLMLRVSPHEQLACPYVHLSVHLWAFQFQADFSCFGSQHTSWRDLKDSCRVAIKRFMVAGAGLAPRMVHRGTRSKAAQDRRAERGSLQRKEEPYQVSSVKLLERSECGRPATLKKEKEINALSHGYSGADCRGNERNAETDRGAGRPVGGGTPPWRKPRQSGTGVGQVDDATSTAASRKVGGHKGE